MAEEEEVVMEVEAVQSVYGEDCVVLDSYPPHLHLHIKPRTADISSQQFVEAIMGIRADLKYPEEPPVISLIDSKGLDQQRQKHLMSSVREKASEFSSSLMLVALCEEAVERLTIMNHPDGDCPLCLYPLVPEDGQSNQLPFMKLMSCFHCFHRECIIRWWNWLLTQKEADSNDSNPVREIRDQQGNAGPTDRNLGNCPVCRKVFDASDLEHVLDLVGAQSSRQGSAAADGDDGTVLLQSDSEDTRRKRFEAVLKLQEERGGLVQPKKSISVVPGMYLPPSVTPTPPPPSSSTEEAAELQEQEAKPAAETNPSSSSNRKARGRRRNFNSRKQSSEAPARSTRQWVQKK